MYQASGIFAPLTVPELAQLDKRMCEAQIRNPGGYDQQAVYDDITDIRRDVNAEWGNR